MRNIARERWESFTDRISKGIETMGSTYRKGELSLQNMLKIYRRRLAVGKENGGDFGFGEGNKFKDSLLIILEMHHIRLDSNLYKKIIIK